jgi:hypothetical protein
MQLVSELGSYFWADLVGNRVSPLFSTDEAAWHWFDEQDIEIEDEEA